MRTSANRNDPGFLLFWLLRDGGIDFEVKLDGTPLRHVVTADEEQGFVVVHCTDEHGRKIIDRVAERVLTETRFGCVDVVLRQGALC